MQFVKGPPLVRVSIYDHAGTLQILDASGDFTGGVLEYEHGPDGCGSATLTLGLRYEEVWAKGYWTARNIVEISSGDDELQTSCAAFATKLYVGSKLAYDTAQGHETGQIAMWDGATLTMRIPVTGVGTDGGGDYITIGAPIAGGGNPTTLPAYAAGTVIYRRRYAGSIMQTQRPNELAPKVVVRCAGLVQRLSERVCSFTLNNGLVDMGTAIYDLLAQFASTWPELTISAGNFPATGQTSFDNSYERVQVSRVIGDLLAAANTTGDVWHVRVGHDRVVKLVKLYTQSGNTYAYNLTLPQGSTYFEPREVVNTDQDASQLYNSIEVIGDTNPATQQPYRAIVQDATSISLYGQIDAQPITNTACKSDSQCAQHGQALLNQQAVARSNAEFVISTRNDVAVTGAPMGLSRGDVVLGVHNVTLSSFDSNAASKNNAPDSEITASATWTNAGLTFHAGGGPGNSNIWQVAASTGATIYVDSPTVPVAPGRQFTFSTNISSFNVTAGTMEVVILCDAGGSTTQLGIVTQPNGSSGRVTIGPFTIPANTTKLWYRYEANAPTVNGASAYFCQPMLSDGGVDLPYVPNYGAPNLSGLVVSAVSMIETAGDMTQKVRFSAIEPNWNDAIAERANALATALQQNTATTGSIASYCVSPAAFASFPFSTSGLVVTYPAFLALFAAGSTPVSIVGGTFTLNASATNWVWLTSSGTWNVQTSPATQTGQILFGIFQTSASAVIGQTQKAPIGVITSVGTQQLATMPAGIKSVGPTVTVQALGAQNSGNGYALQDISFDVSDNPAQWCAGVYAALRVHGTTNNVGQPTQLPMLTGSSPTWGTTGTVPIPAGATVDIGIFYVDQTGTPSAIWWPTSGAFYGVAGGQISPPTAIYGSSNTNLLTDPDFKYTTNGPSASVAGGLSYWSLVGYDAAVFGVFTPGSGQSPANNHLGVQAGVAKSFCAYSEPINVYPGEQLCVTAGVGHNTSSGNFYFALVSVADKTANNLDPVTVYASHTIPPGNNAGEVDTFTYTVPNSGGPTQVVFAWYGIGVIGNATCNQPQVEIGTAYSGYKSSANAALTATGGTAYTAAPAPVQSTVAPSAGADGSYLQPTIISGRHFYGGNSGDTSPMVDSSSNVLFTRHATEVQQVRQLNLIKNGEFSISNGVGAYPWQTLGGSTVSTVAGALTIGTVSYPALKVLASAGGVGAAHQFTVIPGIKYTYAVPIYMPTASVTGSPVVTVAIRNLSRAAQYNSSPGAPAGSIPSSYTWTGSSTNGSTTGTTGQWVLVYGTFSAPTTTSQVQLEVTQNGGTADLYVFRPMVCPGGKWQDYSNATDPANDLNGYFGSSTVLNNQGSLLPIPTDFLLTYSFPVGQVYMTYYFNGAGGSGTNVNFYLPDGSTFTAPYQGTSGAPLSTPNFANGNTIYALIYWSKTASTWSSNFQASVFSASQVAAAFRDGYVALLASYTNSGALPGGTIGSGQSNTQKGTGGRFQ